jgi:UDP-N-acetylglucosamine 2-epimerase (non-hydrolysing)
MTSLYKQRHGGAMLNVLSVVGTRPEAIKMAPIIKEFRNKQHRVRSVVCFTGQHREMLDGIPELFAMQPDYDLKVMRPNQSLSEVTARLLTALDAVIEEVRPHWVLAQGDTTTAMVAAMVAYYHGISFGHVEAGLRTGDKRRPFPEEINRRLADVMADAFFAPTEGARAALLREGVRAQDIYVTGNTVVDAVLDIASREYHWCTSPLARIPKERKLVLITAHRRESFGEPFRQLCGAIRDLALHFMNDSVHFVYPVHLNPNVGAPVNEILGGLPNVSLIEPLDYMSFVQLMKQSVLILTDSGGVQEEAPSFQVPVLVMRDTTERPEGVEAGVVHLVGTDRKRIVSEAIRLISDRAARTAMTTARNPYGDGKAAERIVSALLERYDA